MRNILNLLIWCVLACCVEAQELKLMNPEFREKDGKIMSWHSFNGNPVSVPYPEKAGYCAVKLESRTVANWFGVEQVLPVSRLPQLAPGQKLRFTLEYCQKNVKVLDGGLITFAFFSKTGQQLAYVDGKKNPGTFDWTEISVSGDFKTIPADAVSFGVRLYLGKTSGAVYFAEPRLFVDVVDGQ